MLTTNGFGFLSWCCTLTFHFINNIAVFCTGCVRLLLLLWLWCLLLHVFNSKPCRTNSLATYALREVGWPFVQHFLYQLILLRKHMRLVHTQDLPLLIEYWCCIRARATSFNDKVFAASHLRIAPYRLAEWWLWWPHLHVILNHRLRKLSFHCLPLLTRLVTPPGLSLWYELWLMLLRLGILRLGHILWGCITCIIII